MTDGNKGKYENLAIIMTQFTTFKQLAVYFYFFNTSSSLGWITNQPF